MLSCACPSQLPSCAVSAPASPHCPIGWLVLSYLLTRVLYIVEKCLPGSQTFLLSLSFDFVYLAFFFHAGFPLLRMSFVFVNFLRLPEFSVIFRVQWEERGL